MSRKYRYNRRDFAPLPVRLEHIDIHLDFLANNIVTVTSTLRITAREALDTVTLDARELEIHSVDLVAATNTPLKYSYRRSTNRLIVRLPDKLAPGRTFSIRTRTSCTPSENILEGIYRDTTPPGCPQQYVSQCQQWGFQRIAPVFDDCTAKCTFTTTIEADARYTHLISNGDVSRATNPDGVPAPKPGDPSRKVITYANRIPMAPYLFVVCVGTWDVLEDSITYPSGRKVRFEYLVPAGRKQGAALPMQILKESVLWQGRTQDYEYAREVYRTICMEKSNFGGMENVGNTTIVTDAALVDEYTGDPRLKYAYGVIVHEFEHNQCGSDVTMETPFDMWLNEAFTVDVERQFCASRLDPDCLRLDEVDSMRAPLHGPLAVEDAGHEGRIVRAGFNDPDELVDGLTYVKAAEVIRMLRLILGADTFRKAKNLYFSRYNGANANTDQFFACFEEVSARDLSQFKNEWLQTAGYPRVEANCTYSPKCRTLKIVLQQKPSAKRKRRANPFHIPIELAAVDAAGSDIPQTAKTIELTVRKTTIEIPDVPRPAFVSFNRNCSFYGTFLDRSASPDRLAKQVLHDSCSFNRVEAMRKLTDIERIKLMKEPGAAVSQDWLDIYRRLLMDTSLPPGLKAYFLRIDEQPLDRDYLTWYREQYAARIKLLKTVASAMLPDLLAVFNATDTYRRAVEPKDGIEERKLKATLLRTIIEAGTPEVFRAAGEHFRKAWNITDRISALSCINISDHPSRRQIMEEAYEMWKDHLSAYSSYLAIVSSGTHDDVFDMIAGEEKRSTFKIQHPTFSRSLFVPMAANNKILWTDRGINWVADTVIRLSGINEMTAGRLLACFQLVDSLAPDLKPKVLAALQHMQSEIKPDKAPSVSGRIAAFLKGTTTAH